MHAETDEAPAPHVWPGALPWQRDALREALAGRERGPHALLLTGPEGIGAAAAG